MEEKKLTEEERKQRREDRRKRKKYRLLILLLLMLGTGIMLATSTYAWFTSNKAVSVNTIGAQVEAKGGIQISTDGSKWKSIISTTDITNAYKTYATASNQMPNIIEPVSTVGVPDAEGKLPMYYGTVTTNTDGEYILTAVKADDKDDHTRKNEGGDLIEGQEEGKFVAFDLFLKVDKDTNIYLTPQSGITFADNDSGIKNASRIAFVELGKVDDGSALDVIQGLKTATATHVWEPNYDDHTSYGVANARNIVPYDGIKAPITSDKNILLGNANKVTAADYFDNVTIGYKTTTTNAKYLQIFSLSKGISKVRIYMWIEGQDIDCENNASNGKIKLDLQITTEDPGAENVTTGA